MLNTREALELYILLKDYLPGEMPDTVFEFTGTIIQNIRNSEKQENFGKALMLMSKQSVQELDEIGTHARIELFAEGLKENSVLDLLDFCKIIGF